MSVMFVLLPASLIFAAVAVFVFLRATKTGQFDDLDTPAARVLEDDDIPVDAEVTSKYAGAGQAPGVGHREVR